MKPSFHVSGSRQAGHQGRAPVGAGCESRRRIVAHTATRPIRSTGAAQTTRLQRQLLPTAGSTTGIVSEALIASPTSSAFEYVAVPKATRRGTQSRTTAG